MTPRLTRRAAHDLEAILAYLDERSPQGAENVKRTLQRTIGLIGEFPECGRRTGVADTRVLSAGQYPYLIYRTVQHNVPWIVHIRHAARRPWRGE